jgi:hypothetical protein
VKYLTLPNKFFSSDPRQGPAPLSAPVLLGLALHRRCRWVLLEPVGRAAGTVGRAQPLRDDALEPELTGHGGQRHHPALQMCSLNCRPIWADQRSNLPKAVYSLTRRSSQLRGLSKTMSGRRRRMCPLYVSGLIGPGESSGTRPRPPQRPCPRRPRLRRKPRRSPRIERFATQVPRRLSLLKTSSTRASLVVPAAHWEETTTVPAVGGFEKGDNYRDRKSFTW